MSKLTKAQYAYHVGLILRRVAGESASLAHGMWNPAFCSADADDHVVSLCEDLRARLDNIERLSALTETPPSGKEEDES
jgi:hypothetical protein